MNMKLLICFRNLNPGKRWLRSRRKNRYKSTSFDFFSQSQRENTQSFKNINSYFHEVFEMIFCELYSEIWLLWDGMGWGEGSPLSVGEIQFILRKILDNKHGFGISLFLPNPHGFWQIHMDFDKIHMDFINLSICLFWNFVWIPNSTLSNPRLFGAKSMCIWIIHLDFWKKFRIFGKKMLNYEKINGDSS